MNSVPLASIKRLFSLPICCVLPEDMVSGLAMQGKPVALSWGATKAYCNSLILKPFQPDLCEAFRKLNLQVVPQGFLANLQVSPTLEDQIREAQLLDSMVKKVKNGIAKSQPKYKCYRIDDKDTLFFEDRIVVPKGDLRKVIMNEAHNSLRSIQPGSTKMYHDLKQSYWWTRMKREIAQFVNECDVCRRVKAEHQRPAGLLQPLAIPEWKFDHI